MNNYFGLRFAVNIILVITLGASLMSATSTRALFSPMILYLLPISLDYFTHNPKNGKDIFRKNLGIWVPVILSSIIAGIVLAQLNLDFLTEVFLVKFFLWLPFLLFTVLAGMDWASYSNILEKEQREIVQRVVRSQTFDSHQERISSLNKEKKRDFNPNEEY